MDNYREFENAAQSYNEVGSLSNLKHQITVKPKPENLPNRAL